METPKIYLGNGGQYDETSRKPAQIMPKNIKEPI
jgi:hypothetical protein